jgi:pimeloyl-ACP methyl ester carboxylesterase
MNDLRIAALFVLAPALGVAATGVEGDWSGVLNDGSNNLRTVLHLARAADGSLTGAIDSVDQGAIGIPISKVTEDGRAISIEFKAVGATYDGQWSADGSEITGTFHQRGFDLPLTFRRGPLPEPTRPQNPRPPYPYDAEDVAYENPKTGDKLAGTLTLPRSAGPHPAVLLIPGSGAHDRDETILGHKPFLIAADYLTRRGIAVLRVDDRGVGKSTGRFEGATTVDFAGDARASVGFLKTRKDIDAKQIGLIGHSEGGIIAPMLTSESADIAFIVMLGGPAVTGEETIVAQEYLMNRAMGMPEAAAEQSREVERLILDVVKQQPDGAVASRRIHEGIEKMSAGLPDDQRRLLSEAADRVDKQMATLTSPWYRAFLTYDPRPALEKVKVPVLAMSGALDLQVPPHQNLPAIAAALEAGGNPDYQIVKLAHLNHLFQTAQTGSPTEYAKIEETFAPAALAVLGDWIGRHTNIK